MGRFGAQFEQAGARLSSGQTIMLLSDNRRYFVTFVLGDDALIVPSAEPKALPTKIKISERAFVIVRGS